MTKDEFERAYAKRSACSLDELEMHGRVAVLCNCGDEMCEGWQMAHTEKGLRKFGLPYTCASCHLPTSRIGRLLQDGDVLLRQCQVCDGFLCENCHLAHHEQHVKQEDSVLDAAVIE